VLGLRVLIGIEFLSCTTLFFLKKFASEEVNDLVILDWLFIFAYPMVYIALIFMIFLLALDICRYQKTKDINHLWFISFDLSIPIFSCIIFEQYFSLIGHM